MSLVELTMNDEKLIPDIPHRPDKLLTEMEPRSQEVMVRGPRARDDAEKTTKERVVDVIRTIYDPEIPVNIYELGLIYDIEVSEESDVHVYMTLTSPACPVAGSLPGEVEAKVAGVAGVHSAKVELTWEPPWTPDKMSEEAKLMLNLPY